MCIIPKSKTEIDFEEKLAGISLLGKINKRH